MQLYISPMYQSYFDKPFGHLNILKCWLSQSLLKFNIDWSDLSIIGQIILSKFGSLTKNIKQSGGNVTVLILTCALMLK